MIGPAWAAPMPGDLISPFTLNTQDGKSLSWLPGRTKVFSFCAFWCDTWKEQAKRMAQVQESLKSLPVDTITVSVDGRWAERGSGRMRGTVLLDSGGKLTTTLGIGAVPYTMVVGADGRVLYASQGIARTQPVLDSVRAAVDRRPGSTGEVCLVFDDFPSGSSDDDLLDLLRAEGIPATFFCVCDRVAGSRTVRRAAQEHHSLQIHSWNHDATAPEIERCVRTLNSVGAKATLYHPPGRSEFFSVDGQERHYALVNPYDYTRPGAKEITRRTLLAAKPGCAILLHAGVSQTLDALPEIIRSLRARGFRLGLLR